MIYEKIKLTGNHDEWLAQRKTGIGGSDAGAILGLNKYKSAFAVWCEKTGKVVKEYEDNEAMRLGRDLEDYVASRFTEQTGKKVRKSGFSYKSKEHPFMLANVDRWIQGENALLECKTTNTMNASSYMHNDIPASYYAQCMHYLAVTGADKCYLAVLVLQQGLHVFEIERSEEEISALIAYEEKFWNLVETNTQPVLDGSDSTKEALTSLYPDSDGNTIQLINQTLPMLYFDAKDAFNMAKENLTLYENLIKDEMGESEFAEGDSYKFTWKTSSSKRINTKMLKDLYPDIYEQCLQESTSRRFTAKDKKGK
jgi:putative phage-type endonuclease